MRVLVADDDDDLRSLLVRRLSRRGWEVVAACDGAEALRKAAADPPDVIVLDRSMPVMGGAAALAALRADPAMTGVPIVMLSAEDATESDHAATRQPDLRLRKPFAFDVLDAALRRLVPGRSSGRQGPQGVADEDT